MARPTPMASIGVGRPDGDLVDLTIEGGQVLGVLEVHVGRHPVDLGVAGPDHADDAEELVAQGAIGGLEEDDELGSRFYVELPGQAGADDGLAGRRVLGRRRVEPTSGGEPRGNGRGCSLELGSDPHEACDLGALLVAEQSMELDPRGHGLDAGYGEDPAELLVVEGERFINARGLDAAGRLDLDLEALDARRAAHHLLDPALVEPQSPHHESHGHGHGGERQSAAPAVPEEVAEPELEGDHRAIRRNPRRVNRSPSTGMSSSSAL